MDIYEIEQAAAEVLRLIERNRKLEKALKLAKETRKAQNQYFAARKQGLPAGTVSMNLQQSKVLETELDDFLDELINSKF